LYHDNAPSCISFFTREFFYRKEHDCHPPTLLSSVSPIENKIKGRYFDTNEANEAKSQVVLNTLAEHDFRVALKKNCRRTKNGTTSGMMVASMPKVSF
jgi:hypothetical protein